MIGSIIAYIYINCNWLCNYILSISDNVCLRPWSFERVPNKMIRGLDNALIYTSTKEACLAACLNEVCSTISHGFCTFNIENNTLQSKVREKLVD